MLLLGFCVQSYGGGRDIWGLSDNRHMAAAGFSDPIFDDGLIEVSLGVMCGWGLGGGAQEGYDSRGWQELGGPSSTMAP